jgi:hypothetical protein
MSNYQRTTRGAIYYTANREAHFGRLTTGRDHRYMMLQLAFTLNIH